MHESITAAVDQVAAHHHLKAENGFALFLCEELLLAALSERRPSLLRDGIRMDLGSTQAGYTGRALDACDNLASDLTRIYDTLVAEEETWRI